MCEDNKFLMYVYSHQRCHQLTTKPVRTRKPNKSSFFRGSLVLLHSNSNKTENMNWTERKKKRFSKEKMNKCSMTLYSMRSVWARIPFFFVWRTPNSKSIIHKSWQKGNKEWPVREKERQEKEGKKYERTTKFWTRNKSRFKSRIYESNIEIWPENMNQTKQTVIFTTLRAFTKHSPLTFTIYIQIRIHIIE